MRKAQNIFILLFLSAQIWLIFDKLNSDYKVFNWAMYHTDIRYEAHVYLNEIQLSNHEFELRYKFSRKGQECRGLGNLQNKIVKREKYLSAKDSVCIELNYQENLQMQSWTWVNYIE